jgi:hypothetical protein
LNLSTRRFDKTRTPRHTWCLGNHEFVGLVVQLFCIIFAAQNVTIDVAKIAICHLEQKGITRRKEIRLG